MLLAIDIGNTNINFGVFQGKRITKKFFIPTKEYTLKKVYNNLGAADVDIEEAVICSVVPKATKILKKHLKVLLGKPPYIIGKDIKVPVKNLYRNPKQVGHDRLINAYAGVILYGSPLIVVDFGTAITFDVISKNKEYLGGMILPGLHISLDALAERAALLPKINLDNPKEFIGRSTKESMLSGAVYGFAALTDHLSSRIKDKVGREALVVGTGGDINLISKYCNKINKTDKDLTLKGLNLIYRNIKRQ